MYKTILFGILAVNADIKNCPELTGRFSCNSGGESRLLLTKTVQTIDRTIYFIDGQKIEANQMGLVEKTAGIGFNLEIQSRCSRDLLSVSQVISDESHGHILSRATQEFLVGDGGFLMITSVKDYVTTKHGRCSSANLDLYSIAVVCELNSAPQAPVRCSGCGFAPSILLHSAYH